MLTVTTHKEHIQSQPMLQQWDVNEGILTLAESNHQITESISGFDFRDIDKTFKYEHSKDKREYIIEGYIHPVNGKYCMNSVKVKEGDDSHWEVYYKTQKVFGEDSGYIVTSSIVDYLISDNAIIGVDYNSNAIVGEINGQNYIDEVQNLYCRDTITKWGHSLMILIPEYEVSLDDMKDNLTLKSNTDRASRYTTFKTKSINVFEIDKMIKLFWNDLTVDPSIIVSEDSVDTPPSIESYNSWILPCAVKNKEDLLPLIDLATKT